MIIDAIGVWKVTWEVFPLASGPQDVHNWVGDLPRLQLHRPGRARLFGRKERADQIPLLVGQISGIAVRHGPVPA